MKLLVPCRMQLGQFRMLRTESDAHSVDQEMRLIARDVIITVSCGIDLRRLHAKTQ
jgi:hypothetical protein